MTLENIPHEITSTEVFILVEKARAKERQKLASQLLVKPKMYPNTVVERYCKEIEAMDSKYDKLLQDALERRNKEASASILAMPPYESKEGEDLELSFELRKSAHTHTIIFS